MISQIPPGLNKDDFYYHAEYDSYLIYKSKYLIGHHIGDTLYSSEGYGQCQFCSKKFSCCMGYNDYDDVCNVIIAQVSLEIWK